MLPEVMSSARRAPLTFENDPTPTCRAGLGSDCYALVCASEVEITLGIG